MTVTAHEIANQHLEIQQEYSTACENLLKMVSGELKELAFKAKDRSVELLENGNSSDALHWSRLGTELASIAVIIIDTRMRATLKMSEDLTTIISDLNLLQ